MVYCHECGAEVTEGAKFCSECGATLQSEAEGDDAGGGAETGTAGRGEAAHDDTGDAATDATAASGGTVEEGTDPGDEAGSSRPADDGPGTADAGTGADTAAGAATGVEAGTGARAGAHDDGRDAEETELNLPANQAAALSYVLGVLSGIVVFVVEDENEFVRFHAAQSMVAWGAVVVLYFVLAFVATILAFMPTFVGDLLGALFWLFQALVGLGVFAGWLFLIYQAYEGERFTIPVIGEFAADLV